MIDNSEIINKNYNILKFVKFPISGGIIPDMLFESNQLHKK